MSTSASPTKPKGPCYKLTLAWVHPGDFETASLLIPAVDPFPLRNVRINGRWFTLVPIENDKHLEAALEQ